MPVIMKNGVAFGAETPMTDNIDDTKTTSTNTWSAEKIDEEVSAINNKIGNKFIVVTGTTAESGGNVMTPYPNGCNKNNIVILGCQVQRQDSLDWRSLGVAQWALDDNKPLPRRMFCWAGDDGIGFHTSSVGREEGNPFNNAPFKITLMRTDI